MSELLRHRMMMQQAGGGGIAGLRTNFGYAKYSTVGYSNVGIKIQYKLIQHPYSYGVFGYRSDSALGVYQSGGEWGLFNPNDFLYGIKISLTPDDLITEELNYLGSRKAYVNGTDYTSGMTFGFATYQADFGIGAWLKNGQPNYSIPDILIYNVEFTDGNTLRDRLIPDIDGNNIACLKSEYTQDRHYSELPDKPFTIEVI